MKLRRHGRDLELSRMRRAADLRENLRDKHTQQLGVYELDHKLHGVRHDRNAGFFTGKLLEGL